METLASAGVTAVSLDAIPRTLSAPRRWTRCQLAGEHRRLQGRPDRREHVRALLPAADDRGRHREARQRADPRDRRRGLQAIGTARRLGAVVSAYDVRPETAEQAETLGAKFVKLKTAIDATGAGGYARELTAEERAAQQADLNEVIASQDVVITTAQVPGRKPPLLVTADAVRRCAGLGHRRHGGVALGGNCELSKAGETVVTENGVTIVAPENLPAIDAPSASQFYARNISALLKNMVKDGALNLDFEEEVTKATVITHGGAVVSEAVQKLLAPAGGDA